MVVVLADFVVVLTVFANFVVVVMRTVADFVVLVMVVYFVAVMLV